MGSAFTPRCRQLAGSIALALALLLVVLAAPGARPAHAATFLVNSNGDAPDVAIGNGLCETASPGECTLRAAIQEANFNAVQDTINFSIGGGAAETIVLGSSLPPVTQPAVIDGTSQPSWIGTPLIELNGNNVAVRGFEVQASQVVIAGFVINRHTSVGVWVQSGWALLGNNWIGLNAAGTAASPNIAGVLVNAGARASIGGANDTSRNVISGNSQYGVGINTGANTLTTVEGNFIGTDAAGTASIQNLDDGIIAAEGATIGGPDPNQGNVISGNNDHGIFIVVAANPVTVLNNYIGTTLTGAPLQNDNGGVHFSTTTANHVIGRPDAPNVIAHNGFEGILIPANSENVTIRGNSIHSNAGVGIDIVGAGQGGIAAPVITGIGPVTGTACASCWVEVFSDTVNEGRTYHGAVQATAGGAWTYPGPVDGPNITATASNALNDTSEFSATFARPACTSVCLEGFWHFDYTGPAVESCSSWVNQSGATSIWGHMSCVSGLESNFTGTLNQGGLTLTMTRTHTTGPVISDTGNFAGDGNSASGGWSCVSGCIGTGTWTATRFSDGEASVPAGGGTTSFGSGAPAATITTPSGSPAVEVNAVALTGTEPGVEIARTGYDFTPHGAQFPTTPVILTVDFSGSQNAVPNNNCNGLFHYSQDPQTLAWEFESLVDCDNIAKTFTVKIDSFSVHRFATCPISTSLPNADRNFIDLPPSKAYDDLTRAYSDAYLDACDPDDDNDGRADEDELSGRNCGGVTIQSNTTLEDSDGDRVLDGPECDLGTNPMSAASKPTTVQCGGNADADGDGLPNFRENCYYNTDSTSVNTDFDLHPAAGELCSDGRELASINADLKVDSIDLSQVAQHFGPSTNPNYILDFDFTRDDNINSIDLSQVAQRFGNC